ncbi:MAG: radical SAM/SPASM domain-containing protein [Candidatus Thermoplasmatota archaeon]
MPKCFNGLTVVNVELTSRCNKNCWMCGRRKIDRDYPDIAMNYGDMEFSLVQKIARQLPPGIVVQFHNNGEALLYPRFGEAVSLFQQQIKCVDTNAKLLLDKADEIIGNLDTLTISVIENDPEADEQYRIVQEFLKLKGSQKPNMIYRCLGNVDLTRWKQLPGILATRILHNPLGSFKYQKNPTVPEIGICLDMLSHMAIDRFGKVSICVRFDPKRLGVIGDANTTPLLDIWNSPKRKEWLSYHIEGRRDKIPLCSYCEFWGVPTGY